eukprot:TRINITY_DN8133_c0_g1_i2.p1 TRINITY_DN8133_c0_g1~~TRINITY_DN8133_c0_g1_i2.p1  ORF type:complete len:2292 (-),score=619.73 TRINITY_DN8133_c0_g1_i2:5038-11871(-)
MADISVVTITDAEKDQKKEYHKRHPESIAFDTFANDAVTLDESLLEYKLEGVIDQCKQLIAERKTGYLRQRGGSMQQALARGAALPSRLEPKSIPECRTERSDFISKAQQIPEPQPSVFQADVLLREIDEIGAKKNDPRLIVEIVLQFLQQRKGLLVQKKYKSLLRWARFCTGTELMELLRPIADERVQNLEAEYDEICQRILRLSRWKQKASESLEARRRGDAIEVRLTDDAAHAEMVESPDLDITDMRYYMRVIMHDFKAAIRVTRFLKKLQYLSYTNRFDLHRRSLELLHSDSESPAKSVIPLLVADGDVLQQIVQTLCGVYHINQRRNSRTGLARRQSAFSQQSEGAIEDTEEDLDLFIDVSRVCSVMFEEQVQQKLLPGYDCSVVFPPPTSDRIAAEAQTGLEVTPETTHLKPATWTSYLTEAPRIEEWQAIQQKALANVKKLDNELHIEMSFVDNDDAAFVNKRTRDQASLHADLIRPPEVKVQLTAAEMRAQALKRRSSVLRPSTKAGAQTEPAVPRRLLSYYYLRHAHLRDLRHKMIGILNYLRSVQRRLTIDKFGFAFELEEESDGSGANTERGSSVPAQHIAQGDPGMYMAKHADVMSFRGIQNRDDVYDFTEKGIRVRDSFGVYIVYNAALDDMKQLEDEILRLGTHYINKIEQRTGGDKEAPDRVQMLVDAFESEMLYQEAKRKVVDCYLESYEHVCDPDNMARLATIINELLALRPRFDLTADYFMQSYASEIVSMGLHYNLVRDVVTACVEDETKVCQQLNTQLSAARPLPPQFGFADLPTSVQNVSLTRGGPQIGALDFYQCLAHVTEIPALLARTYSDLERVHQPQTALHASMLYRVMLQQSHVEWRVTTEEMRLTERARVAGQAQSIMMQWTDASMSDDPATLDALVNDVLAALGPQAMAASRRGSSVDVLLRRSSVAPASLTAPLPAPSGQRFSIAIGGDGRRSSETLNLQSSSNGYQLYCNAIEFVTLRKRLLDALYEVELLAVLYQTQSYAFGREMRHLQLDSVNWESTGRAHEQPPEEPFSLQTSEVAISSTPTFQLKPAVLELDKALVESISFDTAAGIKALMTDDGLHLLRVAAQTQLSHAMLLLSAVRVNQIALDAFIKTWQARDTLEKTFITREQHDREQSRQRAARAADLEQASMYFISVNQLKVNARNLMMFSYMDRAAQIPKGKGDATVKATRQLRLEHMSFYAQRIADELAVLSLRWQLDHMIHQVAEVASVFPHDLYPLGKEPPPFKPAVAGATVQTQLSGTAGKPGAVQAADLPKEVHHIISDDGAVINLWIVPHYKSTLRLAAGREPSEQSRLLRLTLTLVDTIANTLALIRAQTSLAQGAGRDAATLELTKMRNEVANLSDPSNARLVYEYLHEKRTAQFYKTLLTLHAMIEYTVNEPRLEALRCVRKTIRNLTAPQWESRPNYVTGLGTSFAKSLVTGVSDNKEDLSIGDFQLSLPSHVSEQNDYSQVLKVVVPTLDTAAEAKILPVLSDLRYIHTHGPYTGAAPPNHLRPLMMFLFELTEAERNHANAENTKIDVRIEGIMTEKKIYATTMPLEYIGLCLEYMRIALTALQFKELLFETIAPNGAWLTPEGWKAAAALYKAKVEVVTDTKAQVAMAQSPEAGKTDTRLRRETQRNSMFMFGLRVQATLARQELDKILIHKTIEQTDTLRGVLIQEQAALVGDRSGDLPHAPHSKAQMLMRFVDEVLSRSVETSTEQGTAGLLITRTDLADAIDTLAQELFSWAEDRFRDQSLNQQLVNSHLNHICYVNEQNMKYLQRLRKRDEKDMQRRIQTEVTDKGYDLIFEIDALKRELAGAQTLLDTQHETVREELRGEYEQLVRDLTLQIQTLHSNFNEYKTHLYQDILSNLYDVRKEAMTKMVENSAAPVELKRKTLRIAKVEEDMNELKVQNTEMQKALMKLKAVHRLKEVSSVATYERQAHLLEEEKKKLRQELHELQETSEQKVRILKQQLHTAQSALAATASDMDTLRRDVDRQTANKQALAHWKVEHGRRVQELEEKLKKYEQWGAIDINKVMLQLEKKEQEISRLRHLEERATSRGTTGEDSLSRVKEQEILRIKKQLQHEKKIKLEAFAKLDELRAQSREAMFTAGGSDDGNMHQLAVLYQRRYDAATEQLQTTARENDAMRTMLRELGVEPPMTQTQTIELTATPDDFRPVTAPQAMMRPQSHQSSRSGISSDYGSITQAGSARPSSRGSSQLGSARLPTVRPQTTASSGVGLLSKPPPPGSRPAILQRRRSSDLGGL